LRHPPAAPPPATAASSAEWSVSFGHFRLLSVGFGYYRLLTYTRMGGASETPTGSTDSAAAGHSGEQRGVVGAARAARRGCREQPPLLHELQAQQGR
jgi:hypothetical protein